MTVEWILAAVVGLSVGSFLGLVAHRLPIMLERLHAPQWSGGGGDDVLPEASGAQAATAAIPAGPGDPFDCRFLEGKADGLYDMQAVLGLSNTRSD